MLYLSYEDYISFGGVLDVTTFERYAFKACKTIDSVTASRVSKMKEVPEAVKRCVYELIHLEQVYEDNMSLILSGTTGSGGGRLVASFHNDGYSETYATGSSNAGEYLLGVRKSSDEAQSVIIKDYLSGEFDDNHTPLLYRGVY